MKHRIKVLLVALLMVSLLLTCALADGTGLVITSAEQNSNDSGLTIRIASALPNATTKDSYKVTLGGNVLNVTGVTSAEEFVQSESTGGTVTIPDAASIGGTSWIFLTDVSTVSTDSKTSYPVTATLDALIDMIGSNDNAALVTTAMPAPEDLTSGKTSLKNQIKAATQFDKNADKLYDAVIASLDYLMTSGKALSNKCLVVLSKGDNKNGNVSLNEVLDKIAASNVAVYTIAYTDGNASRDFGSMAQESIRNGHGGYEINKDNTGGKIQDEAASIIQRSERDRRHQSDFTLDGSVVIASGTASLVITTEGPTKKGIDNTLVITFTDGDLSATAAYVMSDVSYPKEGFFEWLSDGLKRGDAASVAVVAGAVILLALIAMLIIRFIRGKKNKNINYNAGEVVTAPANDEANVTSIPDDRPIDPRSRRLQLVLREATGKIHRAMITPEGISAGRQGDNHVVLDSNDKHISRRHFTVKLQNEDVILESVSETNGTYVNGMRVEGPIALRQKDVIRVGSTEMTVSWKYV